MEAGRSDMVTSKGMVIWFTGRPSSGKTTLANALGAALKARGVPVENIDGDEVRTIVAAQGFDRSTRELHLRYMAFFASVLERREITVIASFVSPYEASRQYARAPP